MDGNCSPCDSFWQDQACHLQSSHSGCNVGDNPAVPSHPPSFFCSGSAASASKRHVYLTECPCTQENSRVQTCRNAFCNLLHTSIRKNKEPGMADPITHEKNFLFNCNFGHTSLYDDVYYHKNKLFS